MKTVTVKINGLEYNLKGKEDEEYLLNVAGYVDGKIREISSNKKNLGSTAIAVLSAINIADELYKVDREAVELEKKKNSLEERHQTLRERLKELRAECDLAVAERDKEIVSLKTTIKTISEKAEKFDEMLIIKKEYENQVETLNELSNKLEQEKEYVKTLESERKNDREVIEAQAEEIKTYKNMIANEYIAKDEHIKLLDKLDEYDKKDKAYKGEIEELYAIKESYFKLREIVEELKEKEVLYNELL